MVNKTKSTRKEAEIGIFKYMANSQTSHLGRIVKVHHVGPYFIAEYIGSGQDGVPRKKPNFANFIVLKDAKTKKNVLQRTSNSWNSLDAALIHCIAYKNLGFSTAASNATLFTIKMLAKEKQAKKK